MKKLICGILVLSFQPALSATYYEYKCNCGDLATETALEWLRGECNDSYPFDCYTSKTDSGFVMRSTYGVTAGTDACARCRCEEATGEWHSTGYGTVYRYKQKPYVKSTYECSNTETTEYACDAGYYVTEYLDYGQVNCSTCPYYTYGELWDCFGHSEKGNKNGIEDCYLQDCGNMESDEGTWVLVPGEKCYYTP